VKPVTINPQWNGRLFLENNFIYTNLKECSFRWQVIKTGFGNTAGIITGKGTIVSPNTNPGETTGVKINVGRALQHSDFFLFTATDHQGNELYTWSWPVIQPWEKASELVEILSTTENEISIRESDNYITVSAKGIEVSFSKEDGTLFSVKNKKGEVSFNGGPVPAGAKLEITGVNWGNN
jgi:hypothetical protein